MRFVANLLVTSLLLAGLFQSPVMAQSVFASTETIDKVALPGLNVTVSIDEKYVSKGWEDQLRSYGRVTNSRSTYRVSGANIPAISTEPISVASQIKSSRGATTVFVSMDMGSQVYVASGTPQYAAAETILKDFANRMTYEQSVRDAENILSEAQKNQQQVTRKGEKLQRDLDNNRKDKEKLMKRLDENAKELDQLNRDMELNKTDQTNALSDVTAKTKSLEAVKAKKP